MTVPFPDSENKLVVPTLPLPNVILYPQALLPLHIFEPRYVELVRDSLESSKQLVLALLKPGWEKDYFGRPPVFSMAGLGEIVHWDRLEGGKYNILLRGLSRVQIKEEFGGGPYRIAQVEAIKETAPNVSSFVSEKVRLLTGLHRISEESVSIPHGVGIGHLTDIVTIALPIEIYRKQEIFEISELPKRIAKVLKTIDEVILRREQFRRVDRFLPSDVNMN